MGVAVRSNSCFHSHDIFTGLLCADGGINMANRRPGTMPLPKGIERKAKTLGYNTLKDWAMAEPETTAGPVIDLNPSDFDVSPNIR